jgi:hypothetical protein
MSIAAISGGEPICRVLGTVEHAEREWLVTARHLIPPEPAPEVRLRSRHIDTRMRLPFLPPLLDSADVAVAPLQEPITPQLELVPSSAGLMWSQQVYFLGFPFGMATQLSDDESDRIAFVKQAIVSASVKRAGLQVWYLDGHNNVGFSGGPRAVPDHAGCRHRLWEPHRRPAPSCWRPTDRGCRDPREHGDHRVDRYQTRDGPHPFGAVTTRNCKRDDRPRLWHPEALR